MPLNEVDLSVMTDGQLTEVVLKTLQGIHDSSKSRTQLEVALVNATCAFVPAWRRGANPVALLAELQKRGEAKTR